MGTPALGHKEAFSVSLNAIQADIPDCFRRDHELAPVEGTLG